MSKQTWDTELYEARHSFVWRMGEAVVDLLAPKHGEKILDLGCGTGQLSSKIAEFGATVVGVDSSPEMVGHARQNFPGLKFALRDARDLGFKQEFDAVFSNATLHWIPEADAVADSVGRVLRPGGRFVVEFGGKGNVRTIETAVRLVLGRHLQNVPDSVWYFPSIAEYASMLEARGFEVHYAHLFDRPTVLEGNAGMENWIEQFCGFYFGGLDRVTKARALQEILTLLAPDLQKDGQWQADYRRIRIAATRL